MSLLALPWFVLATTGDPVVTGLVAAAELSPYVAVQGLGGPLVDRMGCWRASIGTDVGASLAMAAVPALHRWHLLSLPVLVGLVVVVGALRGAGDAARAVLLPGVGALARAPLERTAGLFDGVKRGATLIGGPVAGGLVAVTSPLAVLFLDAGTFAVSAALVGSFVPRRAGPESPLGKAESQTYRAALGEGFRYLLTDRLLVGIGLMVMVTNLLDQAGTAVLVPVWASDIADSPVALGVLGGAFSAGAVLGNVVVTWAGARVPRRSTLTAGFLVASAPRFLALALASSISPVLWVFVIGGIGAGGINPILGAVEYERIPQHLQARVLGALGALAWAGIPAGALVGGLGVTMLGVRGALLAAALLYLVTALAPLLFPAWQDLQRRPAESMTCTEGMTRRSPPTHQPRELNARNVRGRTGGAGRRTRP